MTWYVNVGTMWGERNSIIGAGTDSPNHQFLSSSRLIHAARFTSDFSDGSILLPNVLVVFTALVISVEAFDEPEFKDKNFTS